MNESKEPDLDYTEKPIYTFWDGFLIGIAVIIALTAVAIVMCHLLGYPVVIFEY